MNADYGKVLSIVPKMAAIFVVIGQVSGCSGCVDDTEREPWELHEEYVDESCVLWEPTDSFELIEERTWKRAFEPVRQGCGEHQLEVQLQEVSGRWQMTATSRVCNRCESDRAFRGRTGVAESMDEPPDEELAKLIASGFGVPTWQDEEDRFYTIGCDARPEGIAAGQSKLVFTQVRLAPDSMYEVPLEVQEESMHPPQLNSDVEYPYYEDPVDFSQELELLLWWTKLQEPVTTLDLSNSPDRHAVLCDPEHAADLERQQAAEQRRSEVQFQQHVADPRFPADFESFLQSRDFSQ